MFSGAQNLELVQCAVEGFEFDKEVLIFGRSLTILELRWQILAWFGLETKELKRQLTSRSSTEIFWMSCPTAIKSPTEKPKGAAMAPISHFLGLRRNTGIAIQKSAASIPSHFHSQGS